MVTGRRWGAAVCVGPPSTACTRHCLVCTFSTVLLLVWITLVFSISSLKVFACSTTYCRGP